MSVDQINKEFRGVAEHGISPSYDKQQVIEVTFFEEGCLIDEFSLIEYKAIEALVTRTGGVMAFNDEEFKLYCRTAVATRINWVLGEHYLYHPNEKIMVPSFLENIMMQIGIAQEIRLGVTIRPKAVTGQLLSIDRMREISFYLQSIKQYEGGLGYPKDKSGTWDFMTMTLLNDTIMHYNAEAHPVYALMAAVIGPKLVQSILNPLVRYGDVKFMEGLLWELTTV